MNNTEGAMGMKYSSVFLASIWFIWKARNDCCFSNAMFTVTGVLNQTTLLAWDMQLTVDGFHLDPVNLHWFSLPPGYYKLNADGSDKDGKATYGALPRNASGDWVWGFVRFCGFTSPLAAALMALKEGLMLIHQQGYMRVVVESDSSEDVMLFNGFPDEDLPLLQIILECERLYKRAWSSSVTYVPRSFIMSADCITKFAYSVCF